MIDSVTVAVADWARDQEEIYAVRRTVFVEEQQVPEELERDQFDSVCVHVVARDRTGRAIGTGRLLPDGHIGRVAVLKEWRGRTIGHKLMHTLLEQAAARGLSVVLLNAQTSAVAFYEKLGFRAEGEEFMDAGIPHRTMRLWLSDTVRR